jgi:2-polyprenyl-3-methyl-5-hydroxy-6-metoxy-1,4-benzoquinol methylase
MEVLSPLTNTNDVSELDSFVVERIVESYKNDFGLNVEQYFDGKQSISLYKCNKTGYRFYYPFSLAADGLFYEQLMAVNKVYYPHWKWENEIALGFIKYGDNILDIGCGDGSFLKEVSTRVGVSVEGLELNEAAAGMARLEGLNVHSVSAEAFSITNKGYYDVVTSFQVLEHIGNVKSFLSAKLDLLKSGGSLVIGVPYSNPYLYKKDKYHTLNLPPHHMGLWNEESFRNLTKIFDIEICSLQIDRVDDLPYYTSVQLGMLRQYKYLMKKSKLMRVTSRKFNKILGPLFFFLKGRSMIVVFRKR